MFQARFHSLYIHTTQPENPVRERDREKDKKRERDRQTECLFLIFQARFHRLYTAREPGERDWERQTDRQNDCTLCSSPVFIVSTQPENPERDSERQRETDGENKREIRKDTSKKYWALSSDRERENDRRAGRKRQKERHRLYAIERNMK